MLRPDGDPGRDSAILLRLPPAVGEARRSVCSPPRSLLELGAKAPADGLNRYYGAITVARQLSHLDRELTLAKVRQLQALLLHGTCQPEGRRVFPFKFDFGYQLKPAHGAGLEGFLHGESELARRHGPARSIEHLEHYHDYVMHLLEPVHWTVGVREELERLKSSGLTPAERYERFMHILGEFTADLKMRLTQSDCSRWIREARVYQILPRAFNLPGWRAAMRLPAGPDTGRFFADFTAEDVQTLIDRGFNSLYIIGAFPIGERMAKGSAGGSPFSIRRHWTVDGAHGTDRDVEHFVLTCNRLGVSVLVDLVLNHSAVDADLTRLAPDCYLYCEREPADLRGYCFNHELGLWMRHGGYLDDERNRKEFWTDTLQFNLWNPTLRRLHIASTLDLLERYHFNGFRVDMAYQMLHSYFERNWGDELDRHRSPRPSRELLEELITAIKIAYPGTACVAEGYGGWQELSEAGFDVIFGYNDMDVNGTPHSGWYQALTSQVPARIHQAIQRSAFLHCRQTGGADMFTMFGDHDRPAPWQRIRKGMEWGGFGEDWAHGAIHLTVLKPGPMLFYGGQEAHFEAPCKEDDKSLTFNRPVQIDWSGVEGEFGRFVEQTLQKRQQIARFFKHEPLAFTMIQPPVHDAAQEWAGYIIHRAADRPPYGAWVAVLANTAAAAVEAVCDRPDLGVAFKCRLGPCGPDGVEVLVS